MAQLRKSSTAEDAGRCAVCPRLAAGLAAGALLATATVACGGASPVRIEERDGVTYVDNPAAGLWEVEDPPPVRFHLEQVFGADEHPPEAILAAPRSVDVDAEGNVYVADSGMKRIVSFAPDGAVRWTAGREGEGPGELSGFGMSMAWNGASTLHVTNRDGTQIDLWSVEGEHLGAERLTDLDLTFASIAGFLPERQLVLTRTIMGAFGVRIVVVATKQPWRKIAEFEVDVAPDVDVPDNLGSGPPVRTAAASIHVGNVGSYVLRVYDRTGRLYTMASDPFPQVQRYRVETLEG